MLAMQVVELGKRRLEPLHEELAVRRLCPRDLVKNKLNLHRKRLGDLRHVLHKRPHNLGHAGFRHRRKHRSQHGEQLNELGRAVVRGKKLPELKDGPLAVLFCVLPELGIACRQNATIQLRSLRWVHQGKSLGALERLSNIGRH
eukprot:Amastigsp_a676511_325.p3 type:complete len:144 gc:universal Amastigsp_a676511_325:874-1305(+)